LSRHKLRYDTATRGVGRRAPSALRSSVVAAAAGLVACGSTGGGDPTDRNTSAVGSGGHIPAAWTQAAWFVDPANSSGKASDGNDCASATTACKSFAGIFQRWGTYSPRIRQNTTLTFLSSHTDNSDPVYLAPRLEGGANFVIQGALGSSQQAASGSLLGILAKGKSAGQLLQAILPNGAAVGQLVVNTTRASRAWVYKNVAGNIWLLSQPLQAVAVPGASSAPAEVDTWANGDAVRLYNPVAVNLASASPTATDLTSSTSPSQFIVYQLSVFDPAGAGKDDLAVASQGGVYFGESAVQRNLLIGEGETTTSPVFVNTDFSGNVDASLSTASTGLDIVGGQVRSPSRYVLLRAGDLEEDAVLGVPTQLVASAFGSVFLDHASSLTFTEGTSFPSHGSGASMFWGPGSLNIGGNARLQYPAGTNAAQATFQQAGNITMNGEDEACSVDASGNWMCGVLLTAPNLDQSVRLGGFGGNAVEPGGATISNTATDG